MTSRPAPIVSHEAGHAVVAAHLGVAVRAVLVKPASHPRLDGVTLFSPGRFKGRIQAGLVYMAGPAADCLDGFAPATARRKTPAVWAIDFRRIARHFTPADQRWLIREAMALLEGPCATAWARVKAALAQQDLTGEHVRAAFHGPVDLD